MFELLLLIYLFPIVVIVILLFRSDTGFHADYDG